ncbi:DUF945 family protein [Ottowia testudinis]|uniref:DUF945 family protein n=1 Tax=Ottowia testudinis TaxID=2816950 RepID=A0A975H6F3_9BURK|nr:DUF945 family protein [Ottowia testudinis]QTD45947.1 DUF945 family protein [Ottowia testudinis]
MNKTLVGAGVAVVAAVGAYVGSSWWLGKQVQARYTEQRDKMVELIGQDKLAAWQYDRGVFGATNRWALEIKLPAKAPEEPAAGAEPANATAAPQAPRPHALRIELEDQIQHGPFPGWRLGAAHVVTRVVGVQGLDADEKKLFDKIESPVFRTTYDLTGGYDGVMNWNGGALTHDDPTGQFVLAWEPLEYHYHGDRKMQHIAGRMRLPGVTMNASGTPKEGEPFRMSVRMAGLESDFDLRPKDDQWLLAPGTMTGRWTELAFSQSDKPDAPLVPVFAVKDGKIESKTAQNGELIDNQTSVSGKGNIGQTALELVQQDTVMRNVPAAVLLQLQKQLPAIMDFKPEDEAQQAALKKALEPLWSQLFQANPEYRVKYSATLAGQTGHLAYGIKAQPAPAAADPALPLSAQMLTRTVADADLRLPKAWLPVLAQAMAKPELTGESLTGTLDQFVQMEWIKQEGDVYAAQVRFQQGQLLVNGKPLMGGPGQ